MLLKLTSVQQIQKNYRSLFDEAIESGQPLMVLNNNKPEVIIIEVHKFEELEQKAEKYEQEIAKKAIITYKKEKHAGKLKRLTSLADLVDEN